ncbi:MAG: DUF3540 domain-containing protein [Deltaproteobacteria bacterium]|nr:DUF3540 domain-containing protein [Deltaproteobacteria bacterium]
MTQTAHDVTSLWAGLTEVRVIEATAHTAIVASPDGARIEARLAVPGYRPRAGDRVVVGAGSGGAWVVGVSHALRAVEDIEVRDDRGELLFRRTADGTTVVSVGTGDLELRAPHGVVRISGRAIELEAQRSVKIEGESAVARFEHTELVSGAIDVVAKVARQRYERMETRAKKIVERAVETYREVDDLAHTKAGRVRQLVDDAYVLVSRYASLRAKEDVTIDGDQIRLG